MADPAAILAPVSTDPGSAAVLCDIDGTLAPIVDDPEAASVPPETRTVLAGLARRYRLVACVSGRRASAARRIVGLGELTYAGNHGLELLEPGDPEPRLDPALGHRGSAAAGFASRLDWRRLGSAGVGLRLEDKGPIQAIHWRGAADEELAAERAAEIADLAIEQGLTPRFGRKVLEIRPVADVHKGVVARRMVERSGARTAFFGGDDETDLDAFAGLRELAAAGALDAAVCVAVRSPEGPADLVAAGDLVVDGPEGFAATLRLL